MIHFNGGDFRNSDTLLLAALTLSALTGEPFEIEDVGRGEGKSGVTPYHITALEAIGKAVRAEIRGASVRARRIRFTPTTEPRASDYTVDSADATGRPSPLAVTSLAEALAVVLSEADSDSLITLRGVNTHPQQQSVYWMRETLTPMLSQAGYTVGVELERWGWFPDGGGECTLSVTPREESNGILPLWEKRGNLKAIWVNAALSSRMDEGVGQKMIEQFLREVAFDKIERSHIESDVTRVRSAGAGSGLFVTLESDGAVAGFEAVNDGNTSPAHLAERCARAVNFYLNSSAALDSEASRAMLIPLALSQRTVSLTTPAFTGAHQLLEQVIPLFLPVFCASRNLPDARSIELVPTR